MGKKARTPAPIERRIAVRHLTGKRRGAIVKTEVHSRENEVVKYSLAYINPRISSLDNGRILGYDNSHGHHHRHFMGEVSSVNFTGYAVLLKRFQKEVNELWRHEDEAKN